MLRAWFLAVLSAVPATVAALADASGRKIFLETAEPPCAACHALKSAGSTSRIGPDLDELKPSAARVRKALMSGPGNMPNYDEILSDREIDAVAEYVAGAVGG